MEKLLILSMLFLTACVSPSPEASAPVNIRVICGEKEQGAVLTEKPDKPLTWEFTPGEWTIEPEEEFRFYDLTPYHGGTMQLDLDLNQDNLIEDLNMYQGSSTLELLYHSAESN